jgi:hypothetical protein
MKKRQSIEVQAQRAAGVIVHIVEQLIIDGDIDARGKSAAELRDVFHKWYAERLPKGLEFRAIIDYTRTIWKKAKKAESCNDFHFACLYYATWAEHRLNQVIAAICSRRGYEEESAQMLIRDTGFKAKLLWVQCLLRRRPRKRLFDALVSLAEARNQILHYKWKPRDDDTGRQQKSVLRRAKPALMYLDRIMDSRLMAGSKTQIAQLRRIIAAHFLANPIFVRMHKIKSKVGNPGSAKG